MDVASTNAAGPVDQRAWDIAGRVRPVLPPTRSERAQRLLMGLWKPEKAAGEHWTVCRFAGAWWKRYEGQRPRWERVEDGENLEAVAGLHLDGYDVEVKRGAPKPAALSEAAVRGVLKAAVVYCGQVRQDMPMWLPPAFDDDGEPLWEPSVAWDDQEIGGPIRPGAVMAFQNGLLDTDAWRLGHVHVIGHTGRWFSRTCLPFEAPVEVLERLVKMDEADAEPVVAEMCPRWLAFLEEAFDGDGQSIDTLQRWFGYCLASDTSLEKALFLYGPSGTGKTTIVNVLSMLLGEGNIASTDLNRLASDYGLAPLVGKLLIMLPEMRVGFKTDSVVAMARLLSIIGNDALPVEDKYEKVLAQVRLTGKVTITSNEEPRFTDASAAIIRRLVVLATNRTPKVVDSDLLSKLARELPGILVWAMLGLRRVFAAGGFEQPAEGKEMLDELRRSMSPVWAFSQDECVVGEDNAVRTGVMVGHYNAWAAKRGMPEMSEPVFGRNLRAAVAGVRRVQRQAHGERWREYVGVRPWLAGEDREEPPLPRVVGEGSPLPIPA